MSDSGDGHGTFSSFAPYGSNHTADVMALETSIATASRTL